MLGLDRRVPNDLLSAVSARPPLEIFIKKQVIRYYRALKGGEPAEPRMAGKVLKEILALEDSARRYTAGAGTHLSDECDSIPAMYRAFSEAVADRLMGG